MKFYAEKKFRFGTGADALVCDIGFNDMPDWIQKDPIFSLAVKDGSIKVIGETPQSKSPDTSKPSKK